MEQKKVKILKILPVEQNRPFEWEVEIDGEVKKINSWDKRELKEKAVYNIMLLDEDAKDVLYNQRRMHKTHQAKLLIDVKGNKMVEEEKPKEEPKKEGASIDEGPIVEPFSRPLTPPQKTPQDDFDEEFGSMIEQEVEEQNEKKGVVVTHPPKQALMIPEANNLDITLNNIKKYLATPNVTDSEYYIFLQLCLNQNLNPFIGDVYLVKYGPKAQMIVSKDAFLKKAEQTEGYKGFEAGVVVFLGDEKQLIQRPGSLVLEKEKLVGGWARVHRKDMQPFYAEVSFQEYNTGKSMWAKKPATMIRKVALVQAMREAFPKSFQGMYDGAEIDVEAK